MLGILPLFGESAVMWAKTSPLFLHIPCWHRHMPYGISARIGIWFLSSAYPQLCITAQYLPFRSAHWLVQTGGHGLIVVMWLSALNYQRKNINGFLGNVLPKQGLEQCSIKKGDWGR